MNHPDIIIIGAGAAGLMAARELSSKGLSVIILEARDRIGGRIYTLQTNQFSQPIETGAEFVHGTLPFTIRLLKEAGIKYSIAGGEPVQLNKGELEEMDDFVETNSEFEKRLNNLSVDMTVADFFEQHFNEEKYEAVRHSTRRFLEGYEAADINKASILSMKGDLIGSDWEEQYRIDNGYTALMTFLHDECIKNNCQIHLSNIVQQVDWKTNQVNITTTNNNIFKTQKLLITVPLGVLQAGDIHFSPILQNAQTAINDLGNGSVIKFLFEFDEAFWNNEEIEQRLDKDMQNVGFIFSDEEVPTWWTQAPHQNKLLTGWLGGPNAEALKDKSESELKTIAISSLSAIFGTDESILRAKLKIAYIANWPADPFTKGAYSYPTLQTEQSLQILTAPIDNTIFFAGEAIYKGPHADTVEAALESAVNAAYKILQSK